MNPSGINRGRLGCLEANIEETQSLDLDSKSMLAQAEMRTALENKRYSDNTKNRSILAFWTFVIISLWLIGVVVLLSCNFLSDSATITLLSTTTINIIGLPAIVLRGYFAAEK